MKVNKCDKIKGSWKIWKYDTNCDCVVDYDVFKHKHFMEDVYKAYIEHADNFIEFQKNIIYAARHYFVGKTECEIIVGDLFESDLSKLEKKDMFDQLNMNMTVFCKYLFNCCENM